MDIRRRTGKIVIALLDNIHERRRLILALSCAVVFITTYVLILPAFTLEKDEAAEQGGIDVPAAEQSADAVHDAGANSDESADADSGEVSAGKQESADTGPPVPVTLIYDENKDYSVAVEGDDATLSEDMSVDVREIDCGSPKMKKEYDALYFGALEAVQKEEGSEKPSSFAFAKFYDITLLDGKNKVQPGSPVDVKISFSEELQKELRVKDPAKVHIVHFAVDKETGKAEPEVLDPKTTSIALEHNKVTEAAFKTDSFSVLAVVCAEDTEHPSNVLTADGDDYRITVTYDDDAKIPEGTELIAKEIDPESDEYLQHLGLVWTEANKEYNRVEEMREHYDESMGELPEVHFVNINTSRFFDISLQHDGSEIQPETPVQVEISYDKGLRSSDKTTPGVVTYDSDKRAEILEDTNITVKDGEAESFGYEQKNISAVGTFVGQETSDFITEPKLAAGPDPEGSYSSKNVELSDADIDKIIRSAGKKARLMRAAASETPSSDDDSGLELPTGSKTLKENLKDENDPESGDGTYTLTLSVKGHSRTSSEELVKKSNILFVMDRSSSMITKTVSDESTRWYYGTRNTSSWRGDLTESNGYHFIGIVNGNEVDLNVSYGWPGAGSYYEPVITYGYGRPYPNDSPIYVVSKKTRLTAEQEALNNLFTQLLEKNDATGDRSDVVELSIISFGDQRFDSKSWSGETEEGWTEGIDTSGLMEAAYSNRFTSGTNWEEALEYAKDIIYAKKAADGGDEDYYVVFLTDGEPTAKHGNQPNKADVPNLEAYDAAKDDAKDLVDNNIKFYNIFTYRKNEDVKYSIYLTNYAYGNGDRNNDTTTDAVKNYFADAQTPDDVVNALNNIFKTVETSIGHANVSITDTLTTDAMTTTVVHGKTNGYVYKVTKPDPDDPDNPITLYTVTATGDLSDPTVTFNVPDSDTTEYTAEVSDVGGKKVYSVTTAEGKTYKMALADVDGTTGDLVWDLAPIGVLMDDCTYSVSFIVWPDQDAYDYVAALNNGLTSIKNSNGDTVEVKWDDTKAHDSGKGYMEGGVEQYPSIVKYPDGTYAVLTNKDQKLHYSVVKTVTDGTTTVTTNHGPYYSDLPLPKPMPLKASRSSIEKVWNVARDPDIMAKLLYEGDPLTIGFEISQDNALYTTVPLGWDPEANNGEGAYVWEPGSEITGNYNGQEYTFGTHWKDEFAIATGMMLSPERMEELGLDKASYTHVTYPADPEVPESERTTYYILEKGHDYTIREPGLSYEFDFEAPVYHPMLVDGVLKNVTFTSDDAIEEIADLEVDDDGISTLRIENNLRGYLHLNKVVVDQDGERVPSDVTKFRYTITLENEDAPFVGEHIPWYGINGLFYHDGDFNYYQAEPAGPGQLTLKTEDGTTYNAICSGTFDPDVIGPTSVTYYVDGEPKNIQLYGNQTTASEDGSMAEATLLISQAEVLNIANIPSGTTYSITETETEGYDLVKVEREIKDGELQEKYEDMSDHIGTGQITGTIVSNRDNHVIYSNRRDVIDLEIYKVDQGTLDSETRTYLEKAEFTITRLDENGNGDYKLDPESTTTPKALYYQETFATDENGKITISGLKPGYYEIKETAAPDGYINSGQTEYIKVYRGTITRLSKTEDDPETDANEGRVSVWPENSDNSGIIRYTQATETENAYFVVGNEPGAELPHTGGIGTTIFYILGSMLAVGCAIVLAARRRLHRN